MAIVMGWGKCTIKIGKTGTNDAMATNLAEMGIIKEDSAKLSVEGGNVLEAKETGGKTVAREEMDGNVIFSCRVIEPDNKLYNTLFGTNPEDDDSMKVSTHVVNDNFSLEVTPKNTNGIGIKAAKCNVAFRPGWSDQEGNYADVEFTILATQGGVLYTRFKKA